MATLHDQPPMTRLTAIIIEKNESMMASGIFPDCHYYSHSFLPVKKADREMIQKFDGGKK